MSTAYAKGVARALLGLWLGVVAIAVSGPAPRGIDAISSLDHLPLLRRGARCFQLSSRDPEGGNWDGDGGVLYMDNGKYCVFDAIGAGCLYRTWFTGIGAVGNIQFYFDDEETPRIDMPIAEFFSGDYPHFPTPLVEDGVLASGGFYCYVPMCFEKRLRVLTTGDPWYFQFQYHVFDSPEGITTYQPEDDLSAALEFWRQAGPFDLSGDGFEMSEGTFSLAPGMATQLVTIASAGTIRQFRLSGALTDAQLRDLWLEVEWDGMEYPAIHAPFDLLFGGGEDGYVVSALPFGLVPDGESRQGYMQMPMPFWNRARFTLRNEGATNSISADWQLLLDRQIPDIDSAYYHAEWAAERPSTPDRDVLLLEAEGTGHYVGCTMRMASVGSVYRGFLEGDERITVDGSGTPCVQGTGTEDFFNCGWYFSRGLSALPLNGNPTHWQREVESYTAYRFDISAVVPFHDSIRVSIEHGQTNNLAGNYEWVAYSYRKPARGGILTDVLDVGNPQSEANHEYVISGETWSGVRTYTYEGKERPEPVTDHGRALAGASEFTLTCRPGNAGVVLCRRSDVGVRHQMARVYVDGVFAGLWFNQGGNEYHRWRDSEFLIPPDLTIGKSALRIRVEFLQSTQDWNEFLYWAYSVVPPAELDSDGDLMPDAYEISERLQVMVQDSGEDADGDGMDNAAEHVAGTSARDPESVLSITRIEPTQGGHIRLYFEGQQGREYRAVMAHFGGGQIVWTAADVVGLGKGYWLRVSDAGEQVLEVVPASPSHSYRIACRLAR